MVAKTVLSSARVHASGGSLGLKRKKGQDMHSPGSAGRRAGEVQFLVLATRGQEVTDSGLEDGPSGWLVQWWAGRAQDPEQMPWVCRPPGY